ncbi:uncharacterized protein A1O5_00069 [Cladophialophora psammophila CBS 110553]|uniref:Uncharacterized protein n=1 Tax=Cladophialophora psammophila CBS 110553 TaxID=1182543 RepID=W9X5R6_9EURO|nr:uncharacterized protein A1O5_00069 [Cladophialophora psammophila CBS 110553]EXJ75563.1 hypothetical protein A1O5_00069 [Cladophialophora psammophila CBS 110553]
MLQQLNRLRVFGTDRLRILPVTLAIIFLFALLPDKYTRQVCLGHLLAPSSVEHRQAAFQKLLALSSKPNWGTRGLQAAANLSGLDSPFRCSHTIPKNSSTHSKISDSNPAPPPRNRTLRQPGSLTPTLLKYIIAAGFRTALVLQDDVDPDGRTEKHVQLVSDNMRPYTLAPEIDPTPYGTDWDVLWLGYCGAAIDDWVPPGLISADEASDVALSNHCRAEELRIPHKHA